MRLQLYWNDFSRQWVTVKSVRRNVFSPQVFFPTHLHFIILKKAKEKRKDFLKCASWTDTLVVTMSKRAWERRL